MSDAQDAIDRANAVIKEIEANKEELTQGSPIKVVKTKTLKMHYVDLPIVDTTRKFLYRFEEPVETVWRKGAVTLMSYVPGKSIQDLLREFGLKKWYKLCTDGMRGPLHEQVRWMLEVDSCELIQCEIVPKRK